MDKRVVILSLFLIATVIGQTVAIPLIIPLIGVGVGLLGAGAIGYWLGIQKSEDYQKLIEEYEAQLTQNTIENDINTRLYLQELYARDQNIIMLG